MNSTYITVGATKILVLKIFTIFMLPCAIYMMHSNTGAFVTPELIIDPQGFIIRMDWYLGHIQRCNGQVNLMLDNMHSNVHWLYLDELYSNLKQDIAVIQNWEINPDISGPMKDKIQIFMEMAHNIEVILNNGQRYISFEIDTYSNLQEVDHIGREIRLEAIRDVLQSCSQLHFYYLTNIRYA